MEEKTKTFDIHMVINMNIRFNIELKRIRLTNALFKEITLNPKSYS